MKKNIENTSKEIGDVKKTQKSAATENLHIEIWGVFWLITGIILATI